MRSRSHAEFQYAAADQHAGIDHEDVEATELLQGFRHCVAQLGLIRAVRLDGDGAPAAGRNLLHQFIRLVRRGGVSQGDAGAIFRQAPHNAGTDAARATDDQRDFVFSGAAVFLSRQCSVLERLVKKWAKTRNPVSLPWGISGASAPPERTVPLPATLPA